MKIPKIPLNIIFKEQNPYHILKKYFDPCKSKYSYQNIDKEQFVLLYQLCDSQVSKNDVENIFQITREDMKNCGDISKDSNSIFNILVNYTNDVLEDLGSNVRCKYNNLLDWRMTSHILEQDFFISSYLAYKDILIRRDRNRFDWDTIIKSDNKRLHTMLSKGMAENHFHLKGSSPTFYFSWVSLMNNLDVRRSVDKYIDKNRLEPDLGGQLNIKNCIVVASLIRVILFYSVCNNRHNIENLMKILRDIFQNISSYDVDDKVIQFYVYDIQAEINILREIVGQSICVEGKNEKVDYCITKYIDSRDRTTRIFSGERFLMYECFKKIYLEDEGFKPYIDLFYSYIILKNKFRGEIVQINKRFGFANFLDYQDRKTKFIKKNSVVKESVEPTAIMLSVRNQNLLSIEARIIPEKKSYINEREIKRIDNLICNQIFNDTENYWNKHINRDMDKSKDLSYVEKKILDSESIKELSKMKENYFYVFHFPKKVDDDLNKINNDILNYTHCRHYNYRKDLKKWSYAICNMRENNPNIAKRVLGIDACSNEIVVRPEVFGQTFRFLKAHLPSKLNTIFQKDYEHLPKLRATYHVGEDFLDVADGLRAIDEAITFLELTHGDRIGHATVLGIDIEDWYSKKSNLVYISRQDILDNVAWMIMKIKQFGIEEGVIVIEKLKQIYNKYYIKIFNGYMSDLGKEYMYMDIIPVETYWYAWELRGDNPEYYANFKSNNEFFQNITFWDRCGIRNKNCKITIKDKKIIKTLYSLYHYHPEVKKEGNVKEAFKIERYMVNILKKIQKKLQVYIREKGIGIETNPTSNYLISNFKRYDKHPILNMYNLGLTIDEDKAEEHPQLFVSINTDDQGVFGTLLENEFALMSIALEKARDLDDNPIYNQSMIYDWLDRVRQMGLEQSFKSINNSNSY